MFNLLRKKERFEIIKSFGVGPIVCVATLLSFLFVPSVRAVIFNSPESFFVSSLVIWGVVIVISEICERGGKL